MLLLTGHHEMVILVAILVRWLMISSNATDQIVVATLVDIVVTLVVAGIWLVFWLDLDRDWSSHRMHVGVNIVD